MSTLVRILEREWMGLHGIQCVVKSQRGEEKIVNGVAASR